jgi:threonine dehydratase
MESPDVSSVTLNDIKAAHNLIGAEVIRTPLVLSDAASYRAGLPVYLKLENLQRTGAFKVRGALNKVTSFTAEERQRGIICGSSGNHGLGVAYASRHFGARCIVVLPTWASPHKLSLLKKLDAEIILHGTTTDVRQAKVDDLAREYGYVSVHPFGDPAVIAGQGTVGLEILADLPDVDEIYIPVGGGGLGSGIATAIKESRPATRVYGVEPQNANSMWEALRHHGPFALPKVDTVADGLAARITTDLNYSIVRQYIDEIILVSERQIVEAVLFLLEEAKVLVEPASATAYAGLLANPNKKGKTAVVLSGGNFTLKQLEEIRRAHGV